METNAIAGNVAGGGDQIVPAETQPKCLRIAAKGITTGSDFASMMSALMSDLIEGKVTPNVGNAAVNAGGKLLKIVELQLKYGRRINLIESSTT